jgi:hypothetical protein
VGFSNGIFLFWITVPWGWTFDDMSPFIFVHEKFLFEICPLIVGKEHLISKLSPGLNLFLLAVISRGPMITSEIKKTKKEKTLKFDKKK